MSSCYSKVYYRILMKETVNILLSEEEEDEEYYAFNWHIIVYPSASFNFVVIILFICPLQPVKKLMLNKWNNKLYDNEMVVNAI